MAEVVRNIQVKLNIPESRHSDVDQTFEEFRQAAQHVADHGWNDDPDHLIKAKNKLHEATYTEVREKTNLQSSLVQSARNLAATALGNCKDLLDHDKNTSKPEFRRSVIVYNGRTITYNDGHVTLATIGDRVTAEYVLPHDNEGTPFEEYWDDAEWEKKEATLHKRDGEYYLHVAVEKDVEPVSTADSTENGVVLGVDLNVDGYLAVTSTGAFLGNADYLLGLQHNCVRVLYWTRVTETITNEPLTTGRTDRTKTVETHPKVDREDVLAFVADEDWAWLHPRYRWVQRL